MPPIVLIVENDDDALEIFTSVLRHHGFVVKQARDGREIVRLVQEISPAVVLMDLSMPGVDGWTAVRQLKSNENTSGIPVVALTAHSLDGDKQKTVDAGFDSYLSKPLDPSNVVREVQRLIAIEGVSPKSANGRADAPPTAATPDGAAEPKRRR